MILDQDTYFSFRSQFLADLSKIENKEKEILDFLAQVVRDEADALDRDFARANDLIPFWQNYAPKQRGRKPTGTSIPWSEVGEKSISFHLVKAIFEKVPTLLFPGLPFGGDVRAVFSKCFVHFDVKMTSPNDNPDELVVPPQQVSGDGAIWSNGIRNSPCSIQGKRAKMVFTPKLPPFYVLEGVPLLCLTYFIKAVYTVQSFGVQPLDYMEVASVPNGFLLFDGPNYSTTPLLFIPGKDDKTKDIEDKRIRIRLKPLASLTGNWRCIQIRKFNGVWTTVPRRP